MKFFRNILFLIAIGLQLPCAVVAQDGNVDSLKRELSLHHDSTSLKIYYDLFVYYSDCDNNIAEQYADTLLFAAHKYASKNWEAVAYRSKGLLKYMFGDYADAINYYSKSEVIAKQNHNDTILYKVYNDLGMIYYELQDFKKAKIYYEIAICFAKRTEDSDSYASTLVNIANLYYDTEDYYKIYSLYDSALNIASNSNTKIVILNNLAHLQYFMDDVDGAKSTFSQLLSFLNKSTDIYMYTSVLNSMATIYICEKEYDKAIGNMQIVDSICTENSFDEIRLKLYRNYYKYYLNKGDYEHSDYYIDSYLSLKDSIYSKELNDELKEQENRSEREKAALEMNLRDEEIAHQKTLNRILFAVIAIVLIFIAIVAFLLVKKSRLNRSLNMLNADLKQRDEEISSNLEYAREIQLGCMSGSLTDCNLRMFVLDLPKITVGGDFHIAVSRGDVSYVVVGDCTGHGISGGFLSVLGIKSVYAALEKYDTLPEMASFINNEFCKIVSSADNLKGESLCLSMLRICGDELRFLGSKQKMWLVSDDEIHEYKSTNAIMGSAVDEVFAEEIINVKSDDVVFLSSDGYPDQFGAEGKLKYPRFRNILLESSLKNPDEAKAFLSQKLDEWRGNNEQTDDIMVAGIYF